MKTFLEGLCNCETYLGGNRRVSPFALVPKSSSNFSNLRKGTKQIQKIFRETKRKNYLINQQNINRKGISKQQSSRALHKGENETREIDTK
jgi:hypothetical protein